MARSIEDIMATRGEDGKFGPKKDGDDTASANSAEATAAPAEEHPISDADRLGDADKLKLAEAPAVGDPAAEPQPGQIEPGPTPPQIQTPKVQIPAQGQEPPSDPNEPPKDWSYAAFKDKSEQARKWRERAEALERKVQAYEEAKRQQEQQATLPDPLTDPQAYAQHVQGTFEERLKRQEANYSLRLAHYAHKEVFEQAFGAMMEAAEAGDISVVQGVYNSTDPGEALVRWYKRMTAVREIGDDPAAYKARLREELKAEILAELGHQPAPSTGGVPQNGRPAMPGNLAGQRSVSSRTGPEWGGPAKIGDIFDRKRAQAH